MSNRLGEAGLRSAGAARPTRRSSRAPEGQGAGPGEQMGAHFGNLVLAVGLRR